ncbi:MAG: hypothetical protein AAF721_28810 [Myxococcota bacterium]
MKSKDAYKAILQDLQKTQATRRKHFGPALMLVAIVVVGFFVVTRTRPDLFDQPPAMLALQVVLWGLCLLAMPAIGVGLVFPSRGGRLAIVLLAVFCAMAATTGWPIPGHLSHGGHGGFDRCLTVVLGTGALLLGVGFLSGAFVQRRRVTAVFWVAAGLTLAALNVVTWHCPESGLMHVLPSHVGGAAMLLGVAVVVGIVTHRRARADRDGLDDQ